MKNENNINNYLIETIANAFINFQAKFWLEPQVELAKNYSYSKKQLKEITYRGSLQ